jgi:hypothetical protein
MIHLLSQILKFLTVWVLIPYAMVLFSKDVLNYIIWRLKYKSQGILFRYYPLEGQLALTYSNDNINVMKKFSNLFREFSTLQAQTKTLSDKPDLSKECVMTNNHWTSQPALLIFGKNLLKEYLMRENDYVSRADPNDLPTSHKSYLFQTNTQTGDRAHKLKSWSNRMFTMDKLEKLNKMMIESFERSMPLLVEAVRNGAKDSEGFVDMDVKPILDQILNEIYTSMSFGDYENLTESQKTL